MQKEKEISPLVKLYLNGKKKKKKEKERELKLHRLTEVV